MNQMRICIHEAGHAVMAYSLGRDPGEMCLKTSGDILARTVERDNDPYATSNAEKIVASLRVLSLIHLGGIAAEYILDGKPDKIKPGGGEQDMESILELFWGSLAWRITGQDIINMFFSEALESLEKNWAAVDALAKALYSDGFIHNDRTNQIITDTLEPDLDIDLDLDLDEKI